MQAISLMETLGFAPTWDDLYTECMQPHRSAQSTTQTSVYMHVWLGPHQPSGWAVISERTVTFWKLAPRSSSLSLCISVSPHHSGGRPTKAFVLQWAVQQNLHKRADSILLTEGKKRLRKVEKRLRLRKEEKYNYGRGKTAWKCLRCVCVCVCLRERTSWIEEDSGIHCSRAPRQTGGPRWIQRREKWWEGEAVWAASRWMDGGKWDVVSPGGESCLAPARPKI